MTTLIQRMREELVRRNYAETTIRSYLKAVEHFQEHVNTPLDELGPDDIRSYHAHLLEDRKLAVNTVVVNVCALRFLYIKVLKRRDMKEDLPYPKQRQRLPVILSTGEVAQLIGAASNLYHRTILMTLYSTGIRRAELCRLKVSDIDSERMMLRVVQGKGGMDREVPQVVQARKKCASLRKKKVSPHVLRHAAAMELLQAGVDRAVIALWLGHESVETTQIYLDADLALKEQALAKTNPVKGAPRRFQPDDELLAFLKQL